LYAIGIKIKILLNVNTVLADFKVSAELPPVDSVGQMNAPSQRVRGTLLNSGRCAATVPSPPITKP